MRRTAVLVAAAALSAPASAEAFKGPESYGAYLPVAQAYWGGQMPEGGLPSIGHGTKDPGAPEEYSPQTHEILVNDALMNAFHPQARCALIVHAYGHALGMPHVGGHDVMNPDELAIPEQCKPLSERRASKRPSGRAARRARALAAMNYRRRLG
jgi:hypothetical protein